MNSNKNFDMGPLYLLIILLLSTRLCDSLSCNNLIRHVITISILHMRRFREVKKLDQIINLANVRARIRSVVVSRWETLVQTWKRFLLADFHPVSAEGPPFLCWPFWSLWGPEGWGPPAGSLPSRGEEQGQQVPEWTSLLGLFLLPRTSPCLGAELLLFFFFPDMSNPPDNDCRIEDWHFEVCKLLGFVPPSGLGSFLPVLGVVEIPMWIILSCKITVWTGCYDQGIDIYDLYPFKWSVTIPLSLDRNLLFFLLNRPH